MKILRGSLSEKANTASKLFHIALKGHIKEALKIMRELPAFSPRRGELECYNSRIMLDALDYMRQHTWGRNQEIINQVVSLMIYLQEGDEAWEQMMYQYYKAIEAAGGLRPPRSGEPRSEYWIKDTAPALALGRAV